MITPRTNTDNVLVARDGGLNSGGFPTIMIVPIVVVPILFISIIALAMILRHKQMKRMEARWMEEKRLRAMYGPRHSNTLEHAHSYHYQRGDHHSRLDDGQMGFAAGDYDNMAIDNTPAPFQGGFGDTYGGSDSYSKQAPPSYSGIGGDSTSAGISGDSTSASASASAGGGGGGMTSGGGMS